MYLRSSFCFHCKTRHEGIEWDNTQDLKCPACNGHMRGAFIWAWGQKIVAHVPDGFMDSGIEESVIWFKKKPTIADIRYYIYCTEITRYKIIGEPFHKFVDEMAFPVDNKGE